MFQPDPSSLLTTKLHPPRFAGSLVPRPQLLDRFANTESRRLTLISAPAGYGKTTLVKLWLDDARLPYGWLSLDEYDSDLGTLAGYLVAAVRMAYPGALPTTTSMLTAAFLPEPRRLADVFLRDLEQLAGPIVLVLDDFHLAQSQPVRDFISRVVHHVPEGVHVVLMTRSDPPLSLERLRARGEMNEVRMADLRFSAAESGVLIQQNAGGRVSEDIAALLAERTEGWPAGLQLACLSLRESDDPAAFAQRFAGASDRLVAEYLVNEVLDQLPEDQRRLIVRMSVLDRICGPLCEAISDGQLLSGEGDAFLATTWRSNLFLIALDDEGAWYRYHHLFRDLLRHQLKRNAPAEFVAGLHQRAGAWFEHEGLIEEAIMHAVEGNDSQRAVHLIEANWHLPLKSEDWR